MDVGNYLRFRLRLESSIPSDVHRNFSGTYQPRWRRLSVVEAREIGASLSSKRVPKIQFVDIYPEAVYTNPETGEPFASDDFVLGGQICLGDTKSDRDKGVKTFIITEIDGTHVRTFNTTSGPLPVDPSKAQADFRKHELLVRIREELKEKAGKSVKGLIIALGKHFGDIDESGVRRLEREKLVEALAHYGVDGVVGAEMDELLGYMDLDGDGRVSFAEVLEALRGEMPECRKKAVRDVFLKLDYNKNGVISKSDLKAFYQTEYHPKVQGGEKYDMDVLGRFLSKWDSSNPEKGPDSIPYADFEDYYNGVSSNIDDDAFFCDLLSRQWNLDHRNASSNRVPSFH